MFLCRVSFVMRRYDSPFRNAKWYGKYAIKVRKNDCCLRCCSFEAELLTISLPVWAYAADCSADSAF